ncbi:Prefoldin [Paraphysoderma sedebokerense]|nr:Prefoldin [Paraphysoderma sedebokerense]
MVQPAKQSEEGISLMELPLPQLQAVRQQLDEELSHLTGSYTQLKQAQQKFMDCMSNLDSVKKDNAGKTILVPLTNSLYVPGEFADTENVIIDIGTGYYVSKPVPDAKDFYKRKVDYLKTNLDQLQDAILTKQNNMRALVEVIQMKMVLAQKQQSEGKA